MPVIRAIARYLRYGFCDSHVAERTCAASAIAWHSSSTSTVTSAPRGALRTPLRTAGRCCASECRAVSCLRSSPGRLRTHPLPSLQERAPSRVQLPRARRMLELPGQKHGVVCREAHQRDSSSGALSTLDLHHPESHPRPVRARARLLGLLSRRPTTPSARASRPCSAARTSAPGASFRSRASARSEQIFIRTCTCLFPMESLLGQESSSSCPRSTRQP